MCSRDTLSVLIFDYYNYMSAELVCLITCLTGFQSTYNIGNFRWATYGILENYCMRYI